MKILEMLNQPSLRQLAKVICDYTIDYRTDNHQLVDKSADQIIKHAPHLLYTGSMYRGLTFDPFQAANVADIRQITAIIHEYDTRTDKKYFSWSSKLKGTQTTMSALWQSETDEPPAVIVLSQVATGVDVNKLYTLLQLEDSVIQFKKSEHELLATMTNNVHVHGFITPETHFFPVDQFKQFILKTREEVNQWSDDW